ncbi:MAG: hypothetical protein RLN85_02760 [Pseudomonadales bacterium]
MRLLSERELSFVCGAEGQCTPENSPNNYGGVTDPTTVGGDLINVYEGIVSAVSHIIERVATAFN